MKLNEVTLENIRSQTRTLRLSGLDILTGRNGQGKSTVCDAVALTISGYLYRLGLKPEYLLPLFRDGTMAVGITGVNGSGAPIKVERQWRRKRGGSIEQTIRVSPDNGAKKLSDFEAEIRRHFGACTVALDLNELLSLTDGEQKKLLFGFADVTALGLTRESVLEMVGSRVLDLNVRARPDLAAAAQHWLDRLPAWWGETIDVEDGLCRLARAAEDELKSAKRLLAEAEASMRDMAAQAAQQTAARSLPEIAAELESAREDLKTVNDQIAVDAERRRGILARQKAITDCQAEIQRMKEPGCDEQTGNTPAVLQALRDELAELGESTPESADELEQTREAAGSAAEAVRTATRKNAELEKAITKVETEAAAVRRHECPHCACDIDSVRADILARRAPLQAESADLMKSLDRLRREEAETTRRLDALKRRSTRIREIEQDIPKQRAILDRAEAARCRRSDRLRAQEETLLRLQAEDAAAPQVVDGAALDLRCNALSDRINALEQEMRAATAIHEREGMRLQAAQRRAKAEDHVAILGLLKDAVGPSGVQGEVVAKLSGPITTAANELLALVGPYRLGVRLQDERGNSKFILGWEKEDGTFVTWANLSGGQKAIFGAGLAAAMLALHAPPFRLLTVDGFEQLDSLNKKRLLSALGAFHTAGKLDNVLVAGVTAGPLVPEGPAWTEHKLNGDVHAERLGGQEFATAREAAK